LAPSLFVLANALADLGGWIADVFTRIGDISPYWLVLALILKTCESAFIGLVWRNILRAAYPSSNLSFKIAWGASQGGTAVIPGSSVAGLTSAVVVQSFFFTAVSVLLVITAAILRPNTVSKGSPSDETGNFLTSHPYVIAIAAVAVAAIVYFLWPRLKSRILNQWRKAKQGAAIFRDWRRYGREVALPSAASYCCRMSVNVVFMGAFGIPITVFTVCLVASSHMLSGLFALTPGGVGQTQALDVATLRKYASADSVAAFSVTQDSVMTIWNVVLGIVVMLWAFGYRQARSMVSRRPSAPGESA
jgi:uncharacterized membrane protein YbhN (UPF0104 family)